MSKKTLISAITAALVVGAASTTFAASNPFTDVPADSWAYDAVSTLAADGVIDGYTDGTYKGQNTMTRYEMAQIVARAMAKTDVDKADKALVDKLAAEFADELDNLGVRVSDLEKKSDNVKWGGKVRYRYTDSTIDNDNGKRQGKEKTENYMRLRLEPKAYIGNSGWTGNARIDTTVDLLNDDNATDSTVDRIWVEGPLFGGKLQAGKLPVFTAQGMVFDDPISGAAFTFGGDALKATVAAGRYDNNHKADVDKGDSSLDMAEYYGIDLNYKAGDNLTFNAGYTALNDVDPNNGSKDVKLYGVKDGDDIGIWHAGAKYAITDSFAFVGEYAKSNADTTDVKAKDQDYAYDLELQYKNASKKDAGSYGVYAGYRYMGRNSVIKPTYNVADDGDLKGFVAGVSYVPAENIVASIEYFDGEEIYSGNDYQKIFGQIDFNF